jgi:hypothetical protein
MSKRLDVYDALDAAITVVGLISIGEIDYTCRNCSLQQQKELNCCGAYDNENRGSVHYDDLTDTEYFQCPVSMVPPVISEALDRYKFEQTFNVNNDANSVLFLYYFIISRYNLRIMELQAIRSKAGGDENARH